MKGPPKDILNRYSATTMRDHARDCHYDNLREHGFSERRAREISAKAAEEQARSLDRAQAGKGGVVEASTGRSKFRVPFPWEEK